MVKIGIKGIAKLEPAYRVCFIYLHLQRNLNSSGLQFKEVY